MASWEAPDTILAASVSFILPKTSLVKTHRGDSSSLDYALPKTRSLGSRQLDHRVKGNLLELVTSDLDQDFGTECLEPLPIQSLPCTHRPRIHRPHIQRTHLGNTQPTHSRVREQRPSVSLLVRDLGGEVGELVRGDASDVLEFGPSHSVNVLEEGLGDPFRLLPRQVPLESGEAVQVEGGHGLRVDLSQQRRVQFCTIRGCRQDLKDEGLHLGPKVLGEVLVFLEEVQVEGGKDDGWEFLEKVLVILLLLQHLQTGQGTYTRAVRGIHNGTHLLLVLVVIEGEQGAGMVVTGGDQCTDVLDQADALLRERCQGLHGEVVLLGVLQDGLVQLLDCTIIGEDLCLDGVSEGGPAGGRDGGKAGPLQLGVIGWWDDGLAGEGDGEEGFEVVGGEEFDVVLVEDLFDVREISQGDGGEDVPGCLCYFLSKLDLIGGGREVPGHALLVDLCEGSGGEIVEVGELGATVLAGVVRVNFGGLDGCDQLDDAVMDVVVEGTEGLGVETLEPVLGVLLATESFNHGIFLKQAALYFLTTS